MIEWKEQKHEVSCVDELHDQATLDALRDCGLLKLFGSQNMRI
jgi:hypothetical protein